VKEKEERIKIVKKFADKALKKYGKMVKAIVMMGSVARGEFKPKSDIDVFVILDDTTHKFTPRELDKIDFELDKIAKSIPEAKIKVKNPVTGKEEEICLISIQPSYTLTEFWDYARIGHPIIYNFIKEGVAIYDVGFFTPIKNLLKKGKIPTTREAVESYIESAPKKLMRAKTVKLLMLAEDCYYAMLNSAQAVLMFMGLEPPVPTKAYDEIKKHLVDTGILDPKYAEWLKEIIEIRKKIEHKELLDVPGAFVDEWIEKAEEFVKKMSTILGALEIRKMEKVLERTHDVMQKAVVTALKSLKKKVPKENLFETFKKEFVESGLVENYYVNVWKRVEQLRGYVKQKQFDKIPEKEVYQLRESVRRLIHDLARVLKEKEKK
jgi:predicted nucleotidyltransferase/uncharacterized protein (UPF0332 family)